MKHESAWKLVWIVGKTAFYCLCYEWYRPSREIHSWLKHYKGKMLQMSKTNKPQGSAHCIALHQAFRRKHIGEVDQWPRQQRINYCKHFGSPKEWNVMLLPWCLRPICWGIYIYVWRSDCRWWGLFLVHPWKGPLCTSFYVRRVTLGCRWYMAADSQGDRKGRPMFEDDN